LKCRLCLVNLEPYSLCYFFQVLRDFKRPDGMTENEVDAAGDGENL